VISTRRTVCKDGHVKHSSKLRIEFLLNEVQGQIGALSLDECGNRIQN